MNRIVIPLYGALLLMGLLSGCAQNPVTGETDFVLMSEQEEIAMGAREHPKILKQYGAYENKALQAYVDKVGQQVAARSHRSNLKFHFILLDSTDVNAFALPGGYIYITRGLLAYLNSEAELAAVLGHEIGHVTARHSVRRISTATATQLGITIGSIFIPEAGRAVAQDVLNILNTALIQGYGRDHELEADRLGAEYLARTGYDAQAMIGVIRVLKNQELFEQQLAREEKREPRTYHGVFASHPDNDTRLQQVVRAAERLKERPVTRADDRDTFVKRQDRLVFGSSAREGIIHDHSFYHGELGIALTFPRGWKLQNSSDILLAMAPGKVAALQMTLENPAGSESAKAFLLTNLKLDKLEKGESLSVSGGEGYTGLAPVSSGTKRYRGRVSSVLLNGNAYLFMGVADDEKSFSRYDQAFLETARSLHKLREDERAKAEPREIAVVRVKRGDTFTRLSESSPLAHHAEEQLRLLNDYYPGGEPQAGSLIKVVE
jgi:predicted Zn-dependent protease